MVQQIVVCWRLQPVGSGAKDLSFPRSGFRGWAFGALGLRSRKSLPEGLGAMKQIDGGVATQILAQSRELVQAQKDFGSC